MTSGNLTTGWDIVLRRVRPLTQETDIRNQGDYYPEGIEDEFDSLVMMAQQLQEQIDRCVQAGVGATPPSLTQLNAAVASAIAAAAAAAISSQTVQNESLASQADAEAGTNNTEFMSPLRTQQAITANAPVATLTSVLTPAATVATNAALVASGGVFTLTADQNFTLSNPTNPVDGKKLIFRVKQDATGSRLITLGNKFKVGAGIGTLTLSTTAAHVDAFGAIYNATDDIWSIVAFDSNITAVA
jgi:hypothetical protein